MPLLSIIVPVYKAEQYLDRCVQSVLQQSYKDFELILVDDGSPDTSGEMCEQYKHQDNRVQVVHKTNGGVASARNAGIAVAKGNYVAFIDSDDYIDSDMYEKMMAIIDQHHCDLVICDCKKIFENTDSVVYSHDVRAGYYNRIQLVNEHFPHLLIMDNLEYPVSISNGLMVIKHSLIKENNLGYIEGVRYSEDLVFGAQVLFHAQSFYYMKGFAPYNYVMNPLSATHTFVKDKWKDYVVIIRYISDYFADTDTYDFSEQIDKTLLFFILNATNDIRNASIDKSEKISLIRGILKSDESKKMFANMKLINLQVHIKLKVLITIYKMVATL